MTGAVDGAIRIGTVAAHFRRDVAACLERVITIIADAAAAEVDLLVLPHGALGGYHDHLGTAGLSDGEDLPTALDIDGPEVAATAEAAGAMVVVLGFTEAVDGGRSNTAVCLDGGGLLGVHRKVHLPRGEERHYVPGDRIAAFDTPVGRMGMLVDYDKTFPESTRCLALDGAVIIANPCAWPASRTRRGAPANRSLVQDRQRRMFDTYDSARAAENQVVLISANQTGQHGAMKFFGSSKIVLPDGSTSAFTGLRPGLVTADVDVADTVGMARRVFSHLDERRPTTYDRLR